jgi:hypothetical protein
MTTLGRIAGGVAVAALWTASASGLPQQPPSGEGPLEHFYTAVDAYVALHQAVELLVAPLEITPQGENIHAAIEAMAEAMRAARPAAAEGDVVDATAAVVIRRIISTTANEPGCDVAGVLAAQADEVRASLLLRPLVHDRFDWTAGSFMPGCLLEALPLLPEELHYRFVGRDLVLVDTHADLIVDVLPDAWPAKALPPGVLYAQVLTRSPCRSNESGRPLSASPPAALRSAS